MVAPARNYSKHRAVGWDPMMREIDFTEGKISVHGDWYSLRELYELILERLEDGEHDVTEYAEALRDLDTAMNFWF